MLSLFEKIISHGIEYLGEQLLMLLIAWILLIFVALIPATIVGLVYEVLARYLRSEKIVLAVTYVLAASFAIFYGFVAMLWQYDGTPILYIPIAVVTGLVACNITLRFRTGVLEPKKKSPDITVGLR